ncbi:DNA polymerase III subunit delta' [Tepidimicrobium xylanilyticum]|uniref:DNA polymerase III subunit delta' n=1 Tax=Tepidimicrobium xylanilyticum TaxID=1123352 RepID=A0A1H2WLC7_9FIRM|nr:DNA polymerase III subunit delta' [Tepidimicrobium xylanilyticum]SDW81308.1 DNA polymerase-3 subunit delta' [Tepidimicrobium xylanilyticum]
MDFNEIIGHDRIIENLKNAIKEEHLSHCYLFEGENSIGKKKVALAFAKTLLCKGEGLEPCNRCRSCLKFNSWNHPDLMFIKPENGLIKKKVIDDLIKDLSKAPFESKRRIIIIDDSHEIGIEGQNALLKTLEEPPSYINIILITSNSNNLIPTILSRCEIVKFSPVESHKIIDLLTKKYGKSLEEANFIANFTKGSIGKSIEICESDSFFEKRDEIIEIIVNILTGDKVRIFNSMDFFLENKDNYQELLDIILYWFRDLIIYKQTRDLNLILNRDKLPTLSKAPDLKLDRINDIIDSIIETKQNIDRNVNYQLAIEIMLLRIQEGLNI